MSDTLCNNTRSTERLVEMLNWKLLEEAKR
jgi:hypothetical protein